MPRYIDVDALKNTLVSSEAIGDFGQYLIDIQPVVDVRPEKHGTWVDDTSPDCAVCSNCNERFYSYDNEIIRFRYCPDCGAKMDGEDGDDNG